MKPYFIEKPLSYYWKPYFTTFFRYSCRWKQLFCEKEPYLFNGSFILACESEFLSIGKSILLFTAFFLLVEAIISHKDFLEKSFSTRRRKTGRDPQKMEKKMVSTSRKISCPLARMSSFSQNCFFFIPKMVSTTSEIALTKKYCFH